MGVNKSMKIFFEAMQGNMISGSVGKLLNTPMGPFKWDDLQEAWINVNNGFRLSNISMQEMLLIGYEGGLDGSSDVPVPCDYGIDGWSTPAQVTYSYDLGLSSTTFALDTAQSYTLQGYTCNLTLQPTLANQLGIPITFASVSSDLTFEYTIDGTNYQTINDSTLITIVPPAFVIGGGGLVKFRVVTAAGGSSVVEFIFTVTNTAETPDQQILITTVGP